MKINIIIIFLIFSLLIFSECGIKNNEIKLVIEFYRHGLSFDIIKN